ncbi:hypothetical protein AVEN_237385-1 [Araneus ventricosus]|uniref:Uncharacterized protein n=1 Tax=Araneus ventricosus TaxID=182803 RepID=A0A4Y2JUW4_ARAVE|nr:hypothetical protein AVEN_237385-1 [Araneus ventricosus]
MPIPWGAYQSPNSVGTFNPLIIQLSSVHRSLQNQFETPNPFLSVVSPRTSVFIHSFREWSSAYLFLHWIMVLWLTNSSLPSGQSLLWEGS